MPVFTATTVVATSGASSYSFTIPSGISKFAVTVNEVSLSGTGIILLRLGDSGGIEATGYNSSSWYMSDGGGSVGVASSDVSQDTTGFPLRASGGASITYTGILHFVLIDPATNKWVLAGNTNDYANLQQHLQSGKKALSGELTTVQIVASAGTFDAGEWSIQYPTPAALGDRSLIQDLTPQLGGDLDTNGFDLSGAGDITCRELTITGGQIGFPASQASSGDPNTLDDYEEGTWTPVLTDLTNNASAYTIQAGY